MRFLGEKTYLPVPVSGMSITLLMNVNYYFPLTTIIFPVSFC